tara:strand:- start:185 stop:427 length:243 start_codon:yes stop_codon:yes gene_type:complete
MPVFDKEGRGFKMPGFSGFLKKDDKNKKKNPPLPPDPDREDGGFETKAELEAWMKKHYPNKTKPSQGDYSPKWMNADEVD